MMDEPEYFMGSADWMNRNLHSRIEVCFPVYDAMLTTEIKHILQLQLTNRNKAVLLNSQYQNLRPAVNEPGPAAQESIYQYVKNL